MRVTFLRGSCAYLVLQKMMLQPGGLPTKVVCLTHCLNVDDLNDDAEFEDIIEDMRDEGGKFGKIWLYTDVQFPATAYDDLLLIECRAFCMYESGNKRNRTVYSVTSILA